MAIESGTRLGPYEILSPIGAGGMGEVYKARDTRLERTVAVKVLPDSVAGLEQLRERLAREAKAVSSLNHPHICALYDVGHQDGVDYLVMEYLEGETLGARLQEGPLPLDELLRNATQLADALAVAHRQGLVHRDLKPGNIMLTPGGVKLLDFGLAKSIQESAPAPELTTAPTATSPLTAQGMIVGTYQYMAPEQLEGGEADARSDIFAFGAVVYEMATGKRAFEGKTHASLIASIMKEAPRPLAEMAPMSPPALSRLVGTCLEKDPDARRQTMNDVLLDLRWIAEGGSQAGVPVPVARRRKTRELALSVVALVAVAAAALFAALWGSAGARPERVITTALAAPPEVRVLPEDGLALSPDGTLLAFVALQDGEANALWIRRLDNAETRRLPETDGAQFPFWSPDGNHLGFFAGSKLKRIEARGGPTQVLASASDPRGGTWNADGTIVFTPNFRGGLQSVPATGGQTVEITQAAPESGETSHRWPWFLPGGQHVLFLAQTGEGGAADDRSRVEVLNLETGGRTELFLANSSMQYAPSGHILFWSQGAIYAQPFDAGSFELTGDLFPVADKVQYTVNEMATFSVVGGGLLAFQGGEGVTGLSTLTWFDRAGERGEDVTPEADILFGPRLSHDGKKVAYELQGDIWVRDLVRGTSTRLSFEATDEWGPVWSPDDRWILYSANRGQDGLLVRKLASGLGGEEELHRVERKILLGTDWSRDGRTLISSIQNPETDWDLLSLELEDGSVNTVVETPFFEQWGRLSPDGEWLAYTSNESGRLEVYVVRLSGPGGRWQISIDQGWHPSWRDDGRELYYLAPGGRLMAVSVGLADSFTAGIPEPLFEVPLRPGLDYAYTATADGQRFLINVLPGVRVSVPPTLIQNWPARAGR